MWALTEQLCNWMGHRRVVCWLVLMGGLALVSPVRGDTVLASKHDLSVAGTGTIKAVSESEVCLFCHTPHNSTGQQPLWNHSLSSAQYIPYNSSTIKARVGQPSGSSKLCLSCHDGTVALGMVNTRSTPISMQQGVTTMPTGKSNLGTDLSDDHPISFIYDAALATADGQLRDPAALTAKVRLDANGQLQCTSCHNAHDNQFGKFLVQDNTASALCLNCHNITYWQNTAHRISTKTWDGTGLNPWPNTSYKTVANNACENCHAPHNAGTKPRLLTFALEEQNCFSCHGGTVAAKNIQTEFNKPSVHPILKTSGVHDPTEDLLNPTRHVECQDCHNPHAANSTVATLPNASGALAGVRGVNDSGALVSPVLYEYQLCFRCHADSIDRGPAYISRQYSQTNKRLAFQASNPSYHPVTTIGKNTSVPSLIAPLTTSSRIGCSSCHNNDQGPGANLTGANGPHGSSFPPILERQYITADNTPESYSSYAMCYKCHDRNSVLSDQSFSKHHLHVVDRQISCASCHDPHGVQQNAHLINFNTFYATPSSNGRMEYRSTGRFSGNCSVTCHGKDHNALPYAP